MVKRCASPLLKRFSQLLDILCDRKVWLLHDGIGLAPRKETEECGSLPKKPEDQP